MLLYKLTDHYGYTRPGHYNACLWGEGVSHSGTGRGFLCGPGFIHAYTHPLLAVFLNPIHGAYGQAVFLNPIHNHGLGYRMWEAEGEVVKSDCGLKVGCRTLTTIREITPPEVTTEQRIRFAIFCAKAVCADEEWNAWADDWLNNLNRTEGRLALELATKMVTIVPAARWAAEAASAFSFESSLAKQYSAHAVSAAAHLAAGSFIHKPIDLVALAEKAIQD